MWKRTFALIACCSALAGCTNLNEPLSVQTERATRINHGVQIVDPTATPGAPVMSASKADAAIKSYESAGDQGGTSETTVMNLNMTPGAGSQ